ncbi:hypothetical protein [Embleya sp. NPDC020630]|uniref:hypothetical protein n=1 Tax=Embleya sp. NPDC020630 TaxID=3363979 RepID=UPI0037A8FE6E
MSLEAELDALAAQKDLAPDLVWRLLRHPQARRTAALLRRDLTEAMIEEIIALGSIRSIPFLSGWFLVIRRIGTPRDSGCGCHAYAAVVAQRDWPPEVPRRLGC